MADVAELLYMFEKVKAASARDGVYHTNAGEVEHELCEQLERDGLVRRTDDGPEHSMWDVA